MSHAKVKVKVAKVGFTIVKLGLVVFKNGSDLGYKGQRKVEFGQQDIKEISSRFILR